MDSAIASAPAVDRDRLLYTRHASATSLQRGISPRHNFTTEAIATSLLLVSAVAGALAMLPVSADVVRLWRDDPLRSFGALLPLVAIVLWVRSWRTLQWWHHGTYWGLLPIGCAILAARTYGASLIAYSFGSAEVAPVQPGLLFFLYGSGIALLLGGPKLWRAALFPLCLLLCVNPVPHLFDKLDLPLQEASAGVARAFAHLIGLHPSGVQLQMMFAPRFGIVIVPGCNGVRGSATMAYLALLIGYLRRYRWRRIALYMAGGLLLGYLLNFVRLCCLVVYYRLAVAHPSWRADGEQIDYIIGGTLFLLVSSLAGFILLRPAGRGPQLPRYSTSVRPPSPVDWNTMLLSPRWLIGLAFITLTSVSELPAAWATYSDPSDYIDPAIAIRQIPAQLGGWHRENAWTEIYDSRPVWLWSNYRRIDGASVDIGVWLSPKRHYGIQSLLMNGSHPVLRGGFQVHSQDGLPMELSSYTLSDASGDTPAPVPTFFGETMCLPTRCGEQAVGFRPKGWIVALSPMTTAEVRRLPVLFRVLGPMGTQETPAAQTAARELIADIASHTELKTLVQQMGSITAYRN